MSAKRLGKVIDKEVAAWTAGKRRPARAENQATAMLRGEIEGLRAAAELARHDYSVLSQAFNVVAVAKAAADERDCVAKFLIDISHANAHTKPEAAEALADAAFRIKRLEHK